MKSNLICKKILLAVAVISFMLFLVVTPNLFGKTVNAQVNNTVDSVTFAMGDGAQIRLADDGYNGIRFRVSMPETEYEALMANVGNGKAYSSLSFGVLLAPTSYNTKALLSTAFNADSIYACVDKEGNYDKEKTPIFNFESDALYADGLNKGFMSLYASNVNILAENLNLSFSAQGYIKYTEGEGDAQYRFSNFGEGRAISYVASKALNSGEDYSYYLDTLKGYVNGALDGEFSLEEITEMYVGSKKVPVINLKENATLDVVYTSNNPDVLDYVDGEFVALSSGEATITASIGDSFVDTCTVTVKENRTEYLLLDNVREIGTDIGGNYAVTKLNTVVESFNESFVSPTDELANYIQHDVFYNKYHSYYPASGSLYSFPIEFSTAKPISTDLQAKFNITDWSTAYLGFWAKNDSSYSLRFLSSAVADTGWGSGKETKTLAKDSGWTYIEFDLSNFSYNETENPFTTPSLYILSGLDTSITSAAGWDESPYAGTYYITGFNIYNKTTINHYLLSHYETRGTNAYKYANTEVSASLVNYNSNFSAPTGVSSDNFVKYKVSKIDDTPTNYYGYAINFKKGSGYGDGSTQPISAELQSMFTVTDWSTAYLGFWVYNDCDYNIQFSSAESNLWAEAKETISISNNKTWTHIEFDLSKFSYTSNPFENENYRLTIIFGYVNSGVSGTTQFNASFYIDGFNIYNK